MHTHVHTAVGGCISRRDAIRFANTRNMVAKSTPLVTSAYPPE